MKYIEQLYQFYADYQYWIYAGAALVLVLALAVRKLIDHFKESLHGDAGFADAGEVRKSGLYSKEGMVIGEYKGRVLRLGGDSHCALVAPTRSDKGVAIVVPTISAWHGSAIINDKKDELYKWTSRLRELFGQKVWKWSPYSRTTHRYNPLDYVVMDPMEFVSSIQSIAFILYPPHYKGESMWSNNARALFVNLVMLVKESDDMPSTIGEVFRITGGYGQSVADYLQGIIWMRNYDKVVGVDDKGNETVEYVKKPPYNGKGVPPLSDTCVHGLMRYIKMPKDTGGGVLANCQAALQLWASEIVDAATSESDFDLRTIRHIPQSIYLHIPPTKTRQGGLLLTMFYSQAINSNMEVLSGTKYPIKVLLALDEFGSLNLPIVEETIGEMAGYGLFCLLIMQSKGQLVKHYGPEGAKNIFDNCTATVYFTPEQDDSEEISKMLGDRTVKARSVQIRNRRQGSESDQKRPLMLPQELREMSRALQIIKVKYCRHIKTRKIIWYENPVFRNRFWGVSAKLNGIKSLTKELLEYAEDELTTDVPTLDDEAWLAGRAASNAARTYVEPVIVAATVEDVAGGINLDRLAMELPDVPTGKMTEEQRTVYVASFWSGLDNDNSAGESIDMETGEMTGRVDLSELDAA